MERSVASFLSYRRSHCPLLKSSMNYQQLQEMAKEVPEEEELQFDEGQGDSLNNNRMQITCSEEPTKDVPDNKNQLVWTVDKNKQMQCICLPNRGASLRQVLSKYSNAHTNYSLINCQVRAISVRVSSGHSFRRTCSNNQTTRQLRWFRNSNFRKCLPTNASTELGKGTW